MRMTLAELSLTGIALARCQHQSQFIGGMVSAVAVIPLGLDTELPEEPE